MKQRYKASVSYNGCNYHGWARQPIIYKTVQTTIEEALLKIFNQDIKIFGSGRTDAQVHAYDQIIHFDIIDINISNIAILKALNKTLPYDIHINNVKKVKNDFNARYDVKSKIYEYKINIGKYSAIESAIIYQYNKKINLVNLKKISKLFIGEKDFSSFTTEAKEDPIRKIFDIKIKKDNDIVSLNFKGNGFMRFMVRMLVGTMLALNEGKTTTKDIKNLLDKPKKGSAIFKAPGCGLYLKKVIY